MRRAAGPTTAARKTVKSAWSETRTKHGFRDEVTEEALAELGCREPAQLNFEIFDLAEDFMRKNWIASAAAVRLLPQLSMFYFPPYGLPG